MEETKNAVSKKFSRVYMLDVTANKTQEAGIEYLLEYLTKTVINFFPTAKMKINRMDRE